MAREFVTVASHLAGLANIEGFPQDLLQWMTGVPGLYIYGGFLKRIIDPTSTVPVGDLDLIALDASVMATMAERFGIMFRRVNTTTTRTPFFIGKAGPGDGKIVHLALLRSHEQVMRYVMNNQFDVDRLVLSDHHLFCDPKLDVDAICNAIRLRRATRVWSTRDMTLYAKNRPQIERHYEARIRRKGYLVID